MIKEKKFIAVVKNLTIYADKKNTNGEYINIFLKEGVAKGSFQVTFADMGRFENKGNVKNLVLYNGKTISDNNGTINGFEFSRTEINMSGYDSKSTSIIKTQENKTSELINCVLKIKDIKKTEKNKNNSVLFGNCRTGNFENVILELYKRIISPFYIPVFVLISLLIILRSKDQHNYNLYILKIFILGISTIIFSEISVKFIVSDLYKNFPIIIMPFILFMIIYSFFSNQLKQ
jgi:lipopolysaccharide export LptBFGC system permease protein LptF